MRWSFASAALGALAPTCSLLAQPTPGTAFAGSRYTGTLYTVNLTTGAATQIGAVNSLGLSGGEEVHGLEFAPDGQLYALTTQRLLRVNPVTLATSTVVTHGIVGTSGDLAYAGGGRMLAALGNRFFSVDIASGAVAPLGTSNLMLIGALQFSPDGSTLYATEAIAADDRLAIINQATWQTTQLFPLFGAFGTHGIDRALNGDHYLIDDFSDRLYRVDLGTGLLTSVGATGVQRLDSLAIYIPAPNAATALALGTLCAWRRRR